MSKTQFQVILAGPNINKEIDALVLSESIKALSELLEEANIILNDGTTKHGLKVMSNFREGSFEIDLIFLVQQTLDLLNSGGVDATLDAIRVLKYITKLLDLIKKLKGKKTTKEEPKGNKIIVHTADKKPITTDKEALGLYKSNPIRKKTERLIAEPMQDGKFSKLEIKSGGKKSFSVNESEAGYYKYPDEQELEEKPWTETISLKITRVSFKEGNKWNFETEHTQLSATIEDEAFIALVNKAKISFTKGDILEVRVRYEQHKTETGLHTDHYIEEVLDHIRPKGTASLF